MARTRRSHGQAGDDAVATRWRRQILFVFQSAFLSPRDVRFIMFYVDNGWDGDGDGDGETQQHMSLVVPFVACRSQGGPYEDDGFAAGFQAGEIHRALLMAAPAHAERVRFPMVRSDLLPQLDLLAMHAGFTIVAKNIDERFPQWADITFSADQPHMPGTQEPQS